MVTIVDLSADHFSIIWNKLWVLEFLINTVHRRNHTWAMGHPAIHHRNQAQIMDRRHHWSLRKHMGHRADIHLSYMVHLAIPQAKCMGAPADLHLSPMAHLHLLHSNMVHPHPLLSSMALLNHLRNNMDHLLPLLNSIYPLHHVLRQFTVFQRYAIYTNALSY